MAQNYFDPTNAMVHALAKPQGTQVAGEVLPFTRNPYGALSSYTQPNLGPTPTAGPYAWGQTQDPKISPIPLDTLQQWMERMSSVKR